MLFVGFHDVDRSVAEPTLAASDRYVTCYVWIGTRCRLLRCSIVFLQREKKWQ